MSDKPKYDSFKVSNYMDDPNVDSSKALAPGTSGLGATIGAGGLGQGLKTEINLGTRSMDETLAGMHGAFEKNPFEQAFDGNHSPFNIAHEGFDLKFEKMDLQHTSVATQLNANLPKISSASQGQSQ